MPMYWHIQEASLQTLIGVRRHARIPHQPLCTSHRVYINVNEVIGLMTVSAVKLITVGIKKACSTKVASWSECEAMDNNQVCRIKKNRSQVRGQASKWEAGQRKEARMTANKCDNAKYNCSNTSTYCRRLDKSCKVTSRTSSARGIRRA